MSEREGYSGDFSAYLDGELSESKRQHLDEVLKYDRELAGELDRLRATRELIHSLPVEQPPRHFAERIVTRAERMRLLGSLRQPRSYRWITLATAAVVLVAAGLGGVIIQQLLWKQPAATPHDEVGHVALALEKLDNGDAAKAGGDKVDEVATPSPPKGPGDETAGYRAGKGGPVDGKLGDKALANGRKPGTATVVAALPGGMKSGDPLARTLDKARLAATRLGGKGGGEGDFVIYTNNLAFAQRDVENVLVHNGIHPVRTTSTPDAELHKNIRSRMNFFDAKQITVSQVQYVMFVPPKQAVKIKNELNVIREQQGVSQAAMPPPAVAGAIAPKASKVARGRTGADVAAATAVEELADRNGRSKAKYASEPKSADNDLDKEFAVAYEDDRARRAKAEGKLIAKGEPSSKPLSQKPVDRPRPAAKPGPPGVAIAVQNGEVLPPTPATRPAAGALAATKIQGKATELEQPAEKRPDFGQRPGEPSDFRKLRTAAETTPAKALKRLPSTQNALAMRQAVTSQRAEQAELQIRANVTRLLITLNYRGVQPPRSAAAEAEALMRMRKAERQEASPASKNKAGKANTNQSH